MRTINEHQMRQFLGATGEELLKLRILMEPDDRGNYPESEAARALLAIRQGNRRRDPITEQHRESQERTRKILGGRRRMTRD
jgi:hypothetical protein